MWYRLGQNALENQRVATFRDAQKKPAPYTFRDAQANDADRQRCTKTA